MFRMEIEGTVSRVPEPLPVPLGQWTHSMDMHVKTGVRGGAPHIEHVYVLITADTAAAAAAHRDGELQACFIAAAVWTYVAQNLSGQPVSGLACTASEVKFRKRKVQP